MEIREDCIVEDAIYSDLHLMHGGLSFLNGTGVTTMASFFYTGLLEPPDE